jgi:YD repeat-containing protein
VTQDPGGAALVTATTYEDPGVGFLRRLARTLPATNTTTYAHYGPTEARTNPCPAGGSANQAGLAKTTTSPDPDGAGPQAPRVSESVYDAAGRVVASRVGTEAWTCATYDARGRLLSRAVPANGAEAARTVTYNWAASLNSPLVTSVSDPAGTITTTTDLLGRVVSYVDAGGNRTDSSYDQAGRLVHTAGPGLGWSADTDYDPAGRPSAQRVDGATVAQPSYDAAGELASVSYPANATSGSLSRDPAGRLVGLAWRRPDGAALATDTVTRSQSGRVTSDTVDGGAASSFSYDGPGRLVGATVGGHTLAYGFASSGGCGPLAGAGRNTNRTTLTDNGAATTYCYDAADRLASSSDAAVGTPAYDGHGNAARLGTQSLTYDGADRHVQTVLDAGATVRYVRDATDRIIERRVNGATVARYGYSGPGDSPSTSSYGALSLSVQRDVALVGGVLWSKGGPSGDVWSYPNVHGDVMATANTTGAKVGPTFTYDPFGRALAGLPDNSPENLDYAWLGSHQRPLEHEGSVATIEMGARPYVPSLGRFLPVCSRGGGIGERL